MSSILEEITSQVISGKIAEVERLVKLALAENVAPGRIIEKGLLPGMDVVGERMKSGDMFIPEVLRSAKSMQVGLELAIPSLPKDVAAHIGTVVVGTVQGDLHDIGKNLVSMMLIGAGFKVIDLGTDVKPQEVVNAVENHHPQIVALSALLTTTMPKMEETVAALTQSGMRGQVKIMVGGAPVSARFAEEIGADAYASNGAEAVDQAKVLIS